MINRHLKHWMPALIVAVFISLFSTQYFSSDQTARVFFPLLRWFFPSISGRGLHLLHFAIRKLAHVTEFGVFSVTIFHGIRSDRRGWRFDWAFLTLLIAVAFACADEFHQLFVPGREASPRDVAIDALGALLAQTFVWAYSKWHWGPREPQPIETSSAVD